MNTSKKKTVLDDSASIYAPREEKSDRQKWKECKGLAAKWEHFKAYYLLKSLLILGAVCLVIWGVVEIIKPEKDRMLFVAVLDAVISEDQLKELQSGFEEHIQLDEKTQDTFFDTTMYVSRRTDTNSKSKLTALAFAKELDIVIAKEDVFINMADSYFRPLEVQLPADLYEKYKDRFCLAPQFDDMGVEIEDSDLPYGLYITDYVDGAGKENLVMAICGNTEHYDNAVEFMRYILEQTEKKAN